MNKILPCLIATVVCFVSCNKEKPQPLSKQEIQNRIDSITAIRIREVDNRARIDLEYRIKIEVKVKADSIRQVLQLQNIVEATAK